MDLFTYLTILIKLIVGLLLFALKVMIPSMLAFQDTVQTTIGAAAQLEVHSHGHDHEHGIVGHKHVLDMEHMGVALFAAIVGIGAKEGYASLFILVYPGILFH